MVIEGKVTECDFTGRKYDNPVLGGHCICAGATGRHCCVMYIGPEEIVRQNVHVLNEVETEEYRQKIAAKYGWSAVEF